LRILAQDAVRDVRKGAASNPNTPVDMLEKLSRDNWEVALRVIDNPGTPLALLTSMMEHPNFTVRGYLAKSPKASLEIQERLAHDEDAWVRCQLIEGRKTPVHLFAKLAQDPDKTVRRLAAKRLAQ
jgi:hypothetical protein